MNFSTPFIEYLVIGTHTATWMIILLAKLFDIPLQAILNVDVAFILLGLPFVYILGILFDEITFRPLNPFRNRILKEVFASSICKSEFIAFSSQELYAGYEIRVKRIRILGASIFNWPLLGLSVLLHIDLVNWIHSTYVMIFSIILSIVSFIVWRNLYRRAYNFRKNACDIITEHKKIETPPEPDTLSGVKESR